MKAEMHKCLRAFVLYVKLIKGSDLYYGTESSYFE